MIHSIFLLLIAGILLQIEIRLFSIFVDCNCIKLRIFGSLENLKFSLNKAMFST